MNRGSTWFSWSYRFRQSLDLGRQEALELEFFFFFLNESFGPTLVRWKAHFLHPEFHNIFRDGQ